MPLSVKKAVAFAVVISLLGVAAAIGLRALSFREVVGPVEAKTTYGPVKLTTRLDKNTFRLGEKVNVTVTITNIGNDTVLLGFSTPCKTNYVVCDKSSKTIFSYFHSVGWADIGSELILDPGESYNRTLTWGQLEMDDFPPFATRQVQPGTYYIKGQVGPSLLYVGPPEKYDIRESHNPIKIETPNIEIEIREDKLLHTNR